MMRALSVGRSAPHPLLFLSVCALAWGCSDSSSEGGDAEGIQTEEPGAPVRVETTLEPQVVLAGESATVLCRVLDEADKAPLEVSRVQILWGR